MHGHQDGMSADVSALLPVHAGPSGGGGDGDGSGATPGLAVNAGGMVKGDTALWPWTRCAVLTVTLASAVLTVLLMYANNVRHFREWVSGLLSFLPVITAELVLGVPQVQGHLNARLSALGRGLKVWAVAVPVVIVWAVGGLVRGEGSVLSALFVTLLVAGVLGTCNRAGEVQALLRRLDHAQDVDQRWRFGFTDALVWVAVAAPLDLRWYETELWFGIKGQSYDWWAITASVLLVVGYGSFRGHSFYRLRPTLRDLWVAGLCLLGVIVVVMPVGLGLQFLTFPPTKSTTATKVIGTWLGNVLGVGIIEELLFRCLLFRGLAGHLPKHKWWLALLLSSVAFGLWHWVREPHWDARASYMLLACLAGMFYGLAFRLSGDNILAGLLVHSTTDTIWASVLK